MSAEPAISGDNKVRSALEARIESGSLDLPLLPSSVAQVLELCQSSNTSAAELSAVIHHDPALAGHVIRVTNSPAYSPGSPVASLQQAIGRLGQRAIAEIAVSISVKGSVLNLPKYAAEMNQLWKHAAAAGAYAREIARRRRRAVDAALLCGLLQNMGIPVLVKAISAIESELRFDLGKDTVLDIANDYHCNVGNLLARQWSLPPAVADAILHHHDYASAPAHGDEARMAALADFLATHLLDETMVTELDTVARHPAWADLNLYPDDVGALLAKGPEVWAFVETMR